MSIIAAARQLIQRPPRPPRATPWYAHALPPTVPHAPGVGTRVSPGTVPPPKPTRQITINPTIPHFTPGAYDAPAQADIGAAQARYRQLTGLDANHNAIPGAVGQYQYDRDAALRQIDQSRLDTTENRDKGYIANDNSSAARNIYNSGIRIHDRSDTASNAQKTFNQLTEQQRAADAIYQRQTDSATSDYDLSVPRIGAESDARQYSNWLQNQPIPPAPKTVSVYTLPQWLAYHRNAKTVGMPTDSVQLKARYNAYVAAHSR